MADTQEKGLTQTGGLLIFGAILLFLFWKKKRHGSIEIGPLDKGQFIDDHGNVIPTVTAVNPSTGVTQPMIPAMATAFIPAGKQIPIPVTDMIAPHDVIAPAPTMVSPSGGGTTRVRYVGPFDVVYEAPAMSGKRDNYLGSIKTN